KNNGTLILQTLFGRNRDGRRSPCSTLFPYTTLFRSVVVALPPERRRQVEKPAHAAVVSALVVDEDAPYGRIVVQKPRRGRRAHEDRKSTRLNSSHDSHSYAVICLKRNSDVSPQAKTD